MKTITAIFTLLALSLPLAGCFSSALLNLRGTIFDSGSSFNGTLFNSGLYSHTVEPLTFNRNPTEIESTQAQARGDVKHIQFRVGILWGTNGIGDVARKHGIETVFYADIERRRVLFGLWQEDIVHVYGR